LTPWERKFSFSIGQQLEWGKQLSEKQIRSAAKVWSKALAEGFDSISAAHRDGDP
jgi:hypothetical protein